MQNRTKVWAVGVCLLAVAITRHPPHVVCVGAQGHGGGGMMAPPTPESIEVPARGASLPLHDVAGRAVVDVKINGKGPYRFVLGTVANMTIIDSELNKELQLPVAEGMQAAASGSSAPTIVNINELQMGDAVVRGFIGAVMPLNALFTGPNAPRGIISAGLFQSYLVTYDYPKKRVTVAKGRLDKADKLSTFDYSESRPTLPVKVGNRETRVAMDTSSAYGLTLPSRLQSELPLAGPAKANGTRRTLSGETAVSSAAVSAPVEIGQFKLALKEVSFVEPPSSGAATTGNIGNEVLRNFVVTVDPWNRRIRLTQ